ncbi:MAG: hypothetical protein NVSMB54_07250 [Ktedonobacteraceae bacterium]
MEYLNGNIYHMVHFDNLESIFLRRALLSKEKLAQEGNTYYSIAYDDVQNLRDRVFVWDAIGSKFRSLHSYVPFYIATHTPMLYVQLKRGLQDKIAIFEVSRSIIAERGTIFTNGNASNQQLSKYGSEVADIMPKTIEKGHCRRRYRPSGPYGTNPNCSSFYDNPVFLEELDWDVIDNRDFSETEKVRVKHAEVLVPDILPLSKIIGIAVNNQAMVKEVNGLVSQCNLLGRIPLATLKSNLFF